MAFLSSSTGSRHPGCTFGSPPPRANPTPNRSSFLRTPSNQPLGTQIYVCTQRQSLFHGYRNFLSHRKSVFGVDMWTRQHAHLRNHSSLKRCNGGLPRASENPIGVVTALTVYKRVPRALLSCPFVKPSLACATLGTVSRPIPNSLAITRHPRRIACKVLKFLPIPVQPTPLPLHTTAYGRDHHTLPHIEKDHISRIQQDGQLKIYSHIPTATSQLLVH